MVCTDFCTAAKCAELEARIGALEQALSLLEASFNAHTTADIPTAHTYTPDFALGAGLTGNDLTIQLRIENLISSVTIPLPTADVSAVELYATRLASGYGFYELEVRVNDVSATALLEIEFPPLMLVLDHIYQPASNRLDLYLYDQFYYQDLYTETQIDLNQWEIGGGEHIPSSLSVDLSYANDWLSVSVSDGESSSTGLVFIDAQIINNYSGGGDSVSCETKITECCDQILAAISASTTQLSAENLEIKNELIIDVTGTVVTEYTHEFTLDDNDDIIPTYAESKFKENPYDYQGLGGIHELLKVILTNQQQLHLVGTQGISPPVKIDLQSTISEICNNNGLANREDFPDDQSFFDYLRDIVTGYLSGSLSKFLLKRIGVGAGLPGMVVGTTLDWGIGFLIDKLTATSQVADRTICEAIENLELDTVSVLASPNVATNLDDKVLILHFVTEDNYPKRSRGSNYRPIQIPGAKEQYVWENDFLDLRWTTGNQYAELELNEFKAKVSGWFKDKTAADSYFDWILTLTRGTEKNRRYPDIKVKQTNIVETITRPYRAFIENVTSEGQAVCLVKYVPPAQDEQPTN